MCVRRRERERERNAIYGDLMKWEKNSKLTSSIQSVKRVPIVHKHHSIKKKFAVHFLSLCKCHMHVTRSHAVLALAATMASADGGKYANSAAGSPFGDSSFMLKTFI